MRRKLLSVGLVSALWSAAACDSSSGPASPAGTAPAEIKTLVDLTPNLDVTGGGTGTWNYAGQSFVIPQAGSYNNLRFHWYSFSGRRSRSGR